MENSLHAMNRTYQRFSRSVPPADIIKRFWEKKPHRFTLERESGSWPEEGTEAWKRKNRVVLTRNGTVVTVLPWEEVKKKGTYKLWTSTK